MYSQLILVVLLLGLVAGDDLIQTPCGLRHPDSVLEVPSGTLVEVVQVDGVDHLKLSYPDGTMEVRPPSPHAIPPRSTEKDVPVWNGWMEHYWYGSEYAYFTNPKLSSPVRTFNAQWTVPPVPANIRGNPSAPWTGEPTLSFWPGLQSSSFQTVLQPVLEFNGLRGSAYALSSWNCCPAGFTVHSNPIATKPGDVITGIMTASGSNPYLWNITGIVNGQSTVLMADFTSHKTQFDWAEIISESYFVTACNQLPPTVNFRVTDFTTAAGKMDPASVPWTLNSMVCTGSPCPHICSVSNTRSGATVTIAYKT